MPSRFHAGIGLRVLGFLCVCLLVGAAVGFVALKQYRNVANELSLETARRTSDFADTLKTQIVRNTFSTLHAMSGFQRVRGLNAKDCSDVALFFLESSIGYANIGSVYPDGKIYCAAHPGDASQNMKGMSWFDEAMETGEFTMGNYLISPVTHNGIVVFSLPLKGPDGKIEQVLALTLETDYLKEIVNLPHLPADSSITVIDKSGNVLVTTENSGMRVGENIAHWDVARRAMTAEETFVMESKGFDKFAHLFAATSSRVSNQAMPGADKATIRAMSIIIGIPASRVAATVIKPIQSSGIAIGIVFTIVLIGTYFFIRGTVLRPIEAIQAAAKRLTLGDLTARVKLKPRSDEIGALATAFDAMATSLATREAELRRSNERVKRIFDTEPACVTLLDHNLNVLDVNRAGLEIIGVDSVDAIRGKPLSPMVVEEDRDRYKEHVNSVLNGATHSTTVQIVDQKGKHRWLEIHAAAIQLVDDGPSAYISIARDKSDELATAAQLVQAQKMETVGRLTGGVAHDFNNLLTVVMGNAEILSEQLTDRPELGNLARMIETAAQRGAELSHRMLAFARRQVLRPTELDVNALATRMVDMMGRILGEDIRIHIDLDDKLWFVAADPAQMESAILNLAINARDAMPDGGVLTIETTNTELDADYVARNPEAAEGAYVLIAVSDSGSGMSADVLNRAFDPFFTTKEVGKGSGLGLSMVYGFVKQSQGHIKIYSESANGTTVRIYLPRSVGNQAESDIVAENPSGTTTGSETILVVEDEDAVRVYVAMQLRALGYTVIEAIDANAALAVLASGTEIDLLFTDVVLPGGMNGRQLADSVKKTKPSLKVLYTTGYTENAVVHHGKLDAGVELLSKPYRRAELARHVRKVLDNG